mgnify:CR=1 FL=1
MRYLPAAHMGSPGSNGTIYRIVIHATVSACRRGQAWATAQYFARSTAGGSAHWTTDPSEIVQSVPEDRYAWHAPPNSHSLGMELCDPMVYPGTNRELPASRWQDADHQPMLQLAAGHLRQVADRHRIPLRWLTIGEVAAGGRGFCTHDDVSKAFRQSSHWDPGVGFPKAQFMSYITGGTPPPPTGPVAHDDTLDLLGYTL